MLTETGAAGKLLSLTLKDDIFISVYNTSNVLQQNLFDVSWNILRTLF